VAKSEADSSLPTSADVKMVELYFRSIILKIKLYRIVIISVVLLGSEAWTLILRKEHRLQVFQNRMLRKVFG
jgi:hypothetical protein